MDIHALFLSNLNIYGEVTNRQMLGYTWARKTILHRNLWTTWIHCVWRLFPELTGRLLTCIYCLFKSCRSAIAFLGQPIVELKNDVALVAFMNLQSESASEDASCSECFILIEVSFLTARDDDISQVTFINASVTYDPLHIQIEVHIKIVEKLGIGVIG